MLRYARGVHLALGTDETAVAAAHRVLDARKAHLQWALRAPESIGDGVRCHPRSSAPTLTLLQDPAEWSSSLARHGISQQQAADVAVRKRGGDSAMHLDELETRPAAPMRNDSAQTMTAVQSKAPAAVAVPDALALRLSSRLVLQPETPPAGTPPLASPVSASPDSLSVLQHQQLEQQRAAPAKPAWLAAIRPHEMLLPHERRHQELLNAMLAGARRGERPPAVSKLQR